MRIAISFDYDAPAGYRESFHMRDADPASDQKGTATLLKVLACHGVQATFAIVGEVALAGAPPAHCPDQIREIHAAGHEIASHSMHHKFIPPMNRAQLLKDVSDSRRSLEDCIGAPVTGFVPPFNRPMHYPRRYAPSLSEMLGLHRRGFGRQSISSMLRVLREAGFTWSRVSFSDKVRLALGLAHLSRPHLPDQPFLESGVLAIPCHAVGFGEAAQKLIRSYMGADLVIALGAHPNQAHSDNDESAIRLDSLLTELRPAREQGLVTFHRMSSVTVPETAPREVYQ